MTTLPLAVEMLADAPLAVTVRPVGIPSASRSTATTAARFSMNARMRFERSNRPRAANRAEETLRAFVVAK